MENLENIKEFICPRPEINIKLMQSCDLKSSHGHFLCTKNTCSFIILSVRHCSLRVHFFYTIVKNPYTIVANDWKRHGHPKLCVFEVKLL